MTRFDHFMQSALYHPERGYYTSCIQSVGDTRAGNADFTTTPQLSNSLARAIAAAFRESDQKHLIEVGPGTGRLSSSIRKALPFLNRHLTQQHLVEISPVLRKQQRKAVPQAQHHATLQEALEEAGGQAFIFSNELVDTFPVRIFKRQDDSYQELHLEKSKEGIRETFSDAESLPDSTQFRGDVLSGQRLEIHDSYREWLASWLPFFESGRLLTIDYALPDRPPRDGTLRGYFRHDRLDGSQLYQNAGHIDLTTDVCFPDLIHWGDQLGLTTAWQSPQSEFLAPFLTNTTADEYLSHPDGPGEAFQVLMQER
jgi:SAM-dependent MidA family methyltransferase